MPPGSRLPANTEAEGLVKRLVSRLVRQVDPCARSLGAIVPAGTARENGPAVHLGGMSRRDMVQPDRCHRLLSGPMRPNGVVRARVSIAYLARPTLSPSGGSVLTWPSLLEPQVVAPPAWHLHRRGLSMIGVTTAHSACRRRCDQMTTECDRI